MEKIVLIASAVLCMVAMGAGIEPPVVADFLARSLADRKAILADRIYAYRLACGLGREELETIRPANA